MSDSNDTGRTDEIPRDQDRHWQQVVQRLYEPDSDGGLTTAIVATIADAEGVSQTDVKSPRLYDIVDVSGIENAFFRGEDATRQGAVEFRYTEYLVEVRSDGWIGVYESADPELT